MQTPGKAGPDSCQRIEQLEGELVDCRAYTDILLRTIDALQGGEENRRLQEKNAQIVTLAAQLSATKVTWRWSFCPLWFLLTRSCRHRKLAPYVGFARRTY